MCPLWGTMLPRVSVHFAILASFSLNSPGGLLPPQRIKVTYGSIVSQIQILGVGGSEKTYNPDNVPILIIRGGAILWHHERLSNDQLIQWSLWDMVDPVLITPVFDIAPAPAVFYHNCFRRFAQCDDEEDLVLIRDI